MAPICFLPRAAQPLLRERLLGQRPVDVGRDRLRLGVDLVGHVELIRDLAAAEEWQRNDPYMKAGLFSRAEIRPWKVTANYCKAEL